MPDSFDNSIEALGLGVFSLPTSVSGRALDGFDLAAVGVMVSFPTCDILGSSTRLHAADPREIDRRCPFRELTGVRDAELSFDFFEDALVVARKTSRVGICDGLILDLVLSLDTRRWDGS